MSGFQPTLDFEAAKTAAEDGDALVIDIDGYEGPLHVLLALARNQKVDLLQLSITKLADQYLSFVQQARRVRFSLAADYLVMAAWLTYLKSRLLLPRPERPKAEELPAEEMAAQLAFRLAKLEYARRVAVSPQRLRDFLARVLDGRDSIQGSEIPVETVDDFILFQRLRDVPFMFDAMLGREFSVIPLGARAENEWLDFPDFKIARVRKEA